MKTIWVIWRSTGGGREIVGIVDQECLAIEAVRSCCLRGDVVWFTVIQ